ncbi:hypothetical protein HZ326_7735 [Fusarium oxysporum f. sp. albedinis]|nr:hypothetical protein HZ326_7735 [Fusarium oxysporum f. sp. albedinis]
MSVPSTLHLEVTMLTGVRSPVSAAQITISFQPSRKLSSLSIKIQPSNMRLHVNIPHRSHSRPFPRKFQPL